MHPAGNRLLTSRETATTLPTSYTSRSRTPRKPGSFLLALRVVAIAATVLSMITLSATHSFEASIAFFCSLVFTLILYMRDGAPIERIRNRIFDARTADTQHTRSRSFDATAASSLLT